MKENFLASRFPRFHAALIAMLLTHLAFASQAIAQAPPEPNDKDDLPRVQSFQLKKDRAEEAASLVRKVFGADPNVQIEVDVRTNAIIVRGERKMVEAIQRLIMHVIEDANPEHSKTISEILQLELERQLLLEQMGSNHPKVKQVETRLAAMRKLLKTNPRDLQPAVKKAASANKTGLTDPHRGFHMGVTGNDCLKCHSLQGLSTDGPATSRFSIENLRRRYESLEQAAISLANKENAKEEEVRAAVTKAFDARQSLQTAEIMKTRAELENVATRLLRRDTLKDKIIDRRVAEIMSGDLDWEPTPIKKDGQTSAKPALNAATAEDDPAPLTNAPEAIKMRALLRAAIAKFKQAEAIASADSPDAADSGDIERQARLRAAKEDLELTRQVYETRTQQLAADVEGAKVKLLAAERVFEATQHNFEQGLTSSAKMIPLRGAVQEAKLALERAQSELNLYLSVAKGLFDKKEDDTKK